MNKILITGGTGRLAEELKKHLEGEYVGIEHWDITYPISKGKYDLVLHMAAHTDVAKGEQEPEKCFQANAYGTFNMMMTYRDTPFAYISSEYCHKPISIYALTKFLGEEIVKYHPQHLIMRTLFKPNPFPFSKAYKDQYTQGDYIDVIAELVAKKIKAWDRKTSEFCYIGTGRKTIFELAKRTRPDVESNSVDEYRAKVGPIIPYDYQD